MAGNKNSGRHSNEDMRACWELQESEYYDNCRCARYHDYHMLAMKFDPDYREAMEEDGY